MPSFVVFTKLDGKKIMLAWNNIVGIEDSNEGTVVYMVTNRGSGTYLVKETVFEILKGLEKR